MVLTALSVHVVWYVAIGFAIPAPVRSTARTAVKPAERVSGQGGSVQTPQVAVPKPPKEVKTPVLAVADETPDIKTFRMARPEGWDFTAGQFLTVCIQADGKSVKRAYSISSAPHASGYFEISVKRQGLVSGMLHATVRPGTVLTIRRPAGQFVYPIGDERPIVLLAGGVGITPLMSGLPQCFQTCLHPR